MRVMVEVAPLAIQASLLPSIAMASGEKSMSSVGVYQVAKTAPAGLTLRTLCGPVNQTLSEGSMARCLAAERGGRNLAGGVLSLSSRERLPSKLSIRAKPEPAMAISAGPGM